MDIMNTAMLFIPFVLRPISLVTVPATSSSTKPVAAESDLVAIQAKVRVARQTYEQARQTATEKWEKSAEFTALRIRFEQTDAAYDKALKEGTAQEKEAASRAFRDAKNTLRRESSRHQVDGETDIAMQRLMSACEALMDIVAQISKIESKSPEIKADSFDKAIKSHQILPGMTTDQLRQSQGNWGRFVYKLDTRMVYTFAELSDSKIEPGPKKAATVFLQDDKVVFVIHE